MTPKQLEVLTELVPQAKAIAMLVNPDNRLVTETVVKAPHSKGLDLLIVRAANDDEIDAAFATLPQLHADALSWLVISFLLCGMSGLLNWQRSIPFPECTMGRAG